MEFSQFYLQQFSFIMSLSERSKSPIQLNSSDGNKRALCRLLQLPSQKPGHLVGKTKTVYKTCFMLFGPSLLASGTCHINHHPFLPVFLNCGSNSTWQP